MLVSSIRHSQTDNNSCERLFGIFQRITELILNELLILTHSDNFSWLGHPHVAIVQTRDNLQWDLFDQVTWKSCWKSCWLAAAAVVHFVYAGQCCNSFQVRAFNVHWCDWSTCMARCSFDKIRVIFRVAILHSISSFGQNLPFCWRQWPWPKWRKRRWPKREFQIVLSDLFANLAMFHPILVDAHPPSGK